ncbi:unnamed protein product [Caenorhabditis angaria]|uniref:C-type lectin domain-containing protein n=1 Tax=Caenorhabditis angaria TaxID=860376 RepID=A0A9P1IM89_9PELO|nr:unnamed protein product [Caenorhabditis angaria]
MIRFLILICFVSFVKLQNFDTPIIANGTLNVNVERKCPDGWASFQRQKGLYCIKVFYPPPYLYTQPQAQAMCNEIGARLAGIETIAERNYIARIGASYMTNLGLTQTRVWVGAYRVLQCTKTNVIVDKCSDIKYAFTWSDGNVVGNDQLRFYAADNAGTGQQCSQMAIASFPQTDDDSPLYGQISLLDDVSCDGTVETWDQNQYAQYVCGKLAPIVSYNTY